MKKGECLKFGQIVSISPLEFQTLFIFSDGFIKDTASLTEIEEYNLGSGTRFAQCLYKIYPSFVTSRLQQAIELKEELKKPKYEDESKRVQKILETQQKVIVEYKMNIETSQKLKNLPLSFNSAIQFLHIATNKFLTCNYKEAEYERDNFRLELNEFPSQKSCFRLLPAFQHQFGQEAQIYAGDSVYIELDQLYIGNSSRMHVANSEITVNLEKYLGNRQLFAMPNLKLLERIKSDNILLGGLSKSNPRTLEGSRQISRQHSQIGNTKVQVGKKSSQSKEVNISLEDSSAWIINIYDNENDDENVICYGDIIWIHHVEENSIICMLRNEKDELLISYQDLGEEIQEFQGNSNGMFQVEADDLTKGGPLQWGEAIRLRHFSLGKYLAIYNETTINSSGSFLLYLSDTPTKSSLFQLVQLPSSDPSLSSKYVTKDAFFKLKTFGFAKDQWVHLERQKQFLNLNVKDQVLVEEDIPIISCRLTNYSEDEDVLKLYKANYGEVMETNFLLSCFPVLRESLEFIKDFKEYDSKNREKFNDTVSLLSKVLEELDRFCNNEMINTQLDLKSDKRANINRQRKLREQFFIEIMIEILIKMTTEKELEKYDEHQRKLRSLHNQKIEKKLAREKLKKNQPNNIQYHNHPQSQSRSGQNSNVQSEVPSPCQSQIYQYTSNEPMNSPDIQLFTKLIATPTMMRQKPVMKYQQPHNQDEDIISDGEGGLIYKSLIFNSQANSPLGLDKYQDQNSSLHSQLIINKFKVSVKKTMAINTINKTKDNQHFIVLNKKIKVLKLIYKLLTSICQENEENQYYVYCKFSEFLYQSKYFKEATDCIIKILGGNEQILTNLCDNIRLNETKRIVHKNYTIDQDLSDDSEMSIQPESELEFNVLDMKDVNNNVLLYYKYMTETSPSNSIHLYYQVEQKNIQFIQFFRAICRFQNKGITVNQEMIFKFIKQDVRFKNQLFMPLVIESSQIKIKYGHNIIFLTSINDPEIYNYLIGQLYLYAELALERNFLWKCYLVRIFPIEFVFNQIFDESMNIDYRSAFCNIALSIYVDHEPFNKSIVPNLCRIVVQDDVRIFNLKMPKINAQRREKQKIMVEHLEFLVDNTFFLLNKTCLLIGKELEKQVNLKSDKLINEKIDSTIIADNFITNQLIYDITKLIDMIVTFDIVSLMKNNDKQKDLLLNMVQMLEFDRNNMLFSYILYQLRKTKLDKATKEKESNILKLGMESKLKSFIGQTVQELIEIGTLLNKSILGVPKKQQDSLEVVFSEYDTTKISRNPIIGSLVTITTQIGALNSPQIKQTNILFCDLEIKIKICEIINFFQDQRQNFFIENFLSYYKSISGKFHPGDKIYLHELQTEVKQELVKVLPNLLRTGILSIDEKATKASEDIWQPDNEDLLAVGKTFMSKKNSFTNYLKTDVDLKTEVPDLDKLMSGSNSSIIDSEILPSLLVSFYIAQNLELQDKLIQLMRRCFSQKKELFNYLSRIEILFDRNDIQCYYYLQTTVQNLKSLSECSEVWLVDFLAESQGPDKEIKILIRMVQDIQSLLYMDTKIDESGRIIPGKRIVSFNRQKIFFYLDIHLPILNYIRDTQNQFAKVLRDPFFSQETKKTSILALSSMYGLLSDFCQANEANQAELFPEIQLYLDEIGLDLGQIDLICSIYKDNKLRCEQIPDQLLSQFLRFIKIHGRQERFLRLFIIIQDYQGNYLLENQIKVRKLFIPKTLGTEKFTDIYEYQFYGEFVEEQLKFDFSIIEESKQIDEPYIYHSKILEMLLKTVKGESGFKLNVPHLKRIFNLHYFLELLMYEDGMFQEESLISKEYQSSVHQSLVGITGMKPYIAQLVTQIYINNTVVDQFLFIKEQTTFYNLFHKERLRLEKQYSEKYIQYFFDEIIVMMQYYSTKLILKDGGEYQDRDDYKQLEFIVSNILQMSNNVLNDKLNPMQYNNLIKFVFSVNESTLKQNVGIFSQCLKQTNIQTPAKINSDDQDQDYDSKTVKANIFSKEQQILPDSKLLNKDKNDIELLRITPQEPRISQITQNQKQNKIQSGINQPQWFSHENFNLFRQMCMDSKQYQKELQIELSILGQCFININQFIPQAIVKDLPGVKISFDDILKKLIRFVELGVINKSEKHNLIFTLEILENILENAPDLEQMQNKFDSCQSTKMFLNLLADFNIYPFDDDLMLQLLKFMCVATKGGNIRIQQTIFNYLAHYEKSEMILFKIHSIIYGVIQDQQEVQRQKQQNKIIVELASFQNQFFSQGETQQSQAEIQDTQNDIQSFRKMQQKILIQLLQFLQLICEGHYLSIQNYLRYQENSRNNYNIVQAMVELLQVYQVDLQKEGFEVIVNTLDALTEFIQGPCNKNQQDIIDGQFLDFASQILSMQKKKKYQNIQTPDIQSANHELTTPLKSHSHMANQVDETSIERWMLERLKYKCMVLVTSLLELNTDEMAIKRIMRSLPIGVLKQNLTQVYKKYTKMYGKEYTGEVLNHIYADPNDDTKIVKSGYHELIIETGFFIYFLICYYANLSQADVDLETSKELTNIKNDENIKDNDALGDLKNNIIGQLLSLAYALVEGILESVNSVRASLQKKYFNKKQENINPETKAKNKILYEQELLKQSIQFFAKNSASIEVFRNGKLEKIVFFKISYCNYLPKENKTEFHDNVDRDSINAKINDLVTQAPSIIEICKHEEDLAVFFSKNKFIAIFANYVILWKDLAFMLTIALNIFIIMSYYAGQDGNNDENYYERLWEPRFLKTVLTKGETKQLFSYCGYMMIICSTFVVSFFLMKKGPLYARAAWNENSTLIKEGQVWIVRWFLKLFLVINCLIRVLMNMEVLYYLTYGTLAFIATLFHPFFFAFHLSEVVLRYPVLRNIIKSIWDPKKSLFLTLVLIFILNYYFSLVSYVSLSGKYDNSKCETLIICFMATFDYAFKNNGGIGGWFNGINAQTADNNYSYYQFVYDNLNNIIIQLIMIHIFSGIIIDTFGSLREKQQAKDDDLGEVCFICGQQRELFDRKQDYGFPQHTKKEHYMWNYVFYIAYLLDKKKNERNGIETYISEKMRLQDNSWFPIGQALGLQSETINSQLLQSEQIQGIEQGVLQYIQYKMQGIRKNMDQIQGYIGDINQYQSIK